MVTMAESGIFTPIFCVYVIPLIRCWSERTISPDILLWDREAPGGTAYSMWNILQVSGRYLLRSCPPTFSRAEKTGRPIDDPLDALIDDIASMIRAQDKGVSSQFELRV